MKKPVQSIKQEFRNSVKDIKINNPFIGVDKIRFDELRSDGITIIPDYYSPELCREICRQIDDIIIKYGNEIWTDSQGADHRIFGADQVSESINAFFHDQYIRNFVETYEGTKTIVGFTLAARLEFAQGNLGSGGGWHRDDAKSKQTKAILYLTDTELSNGPFQFLKGSHKPAKVLKTQFQYDLNFNQNRFADEEMDRILQRESRHLMTIPGKAGTLILTDTRGIHRGMPIEAGNRYALTNYFWTRIIPAHIQKIMIKP